MYIHMYVYICICMYVCIYYISICIYVYMCTCICTHICIYIDIFISMHIYTYAHIDKKHMHTIVYIHTDMNSKIYWFSDIHTFNIYMNVNQGCYIKSCRSGVE